MHLNNFLTARGMVMQQSIATKKLYIKVLKLEQEIKKLKLTLLQQKDDEIASIKPISLKGIWKGTKVTEKDIKAAKHSLFPKYKDL